MNLAAVRLLALQGMVLSVGVLSSPANAQSGGGEAEPPRALGLSPSDREYPGEDGDDPPPEPAGSTYSLDREPGWAVGADAYAGIAAQVAAGQSRSHALAGALVRLRWTYIQVGGTYERTDYIDDEWQLLGVHAGAFVPFTRWVDFEFALGGASRRYLSTDRRFGSSGYDHAVPAVTLRAGVSDRSTERLFGARLGGHLVATMDVENPAASYRYEITGADDPTPRFVSGTRRLGSFSLALIVSLGFDVNGRAARPLAGARASELP